MAKPITGFIARSFAPADEERLFPLINFLKAFESLGFHCQSAQPAEAEQVSEKIQKLIRDSDVFIGMFTRKYPIYTAGENEKPSRWTAPSWVLQESGYALGNNRKLIFFVEPDVELPQLQGDFEYVVYDVDSKEKAFHRASEMITKIIAGALAIQIETVVKREEQAPPPELTLIRPDEPQKDLNLNFAALGEAMEKRDDAAANAAFETALIYIRKDRPKQEAFWKCWFQSERASAGYSDALSNLRKLEKKYPESHEPIYFYAECQEAFGNIQVASHEYLRAATKTSGSTRSTMILRAAEALHQSSEYNAARRLLLEELGQATEENRLAILSTIYEGFNLSSRPYEAFGIGEYSIFENGAQPDLHFNIGFQCGEASLNELAVFHYKSVLSQNNQNSAALNNLGVAFAALDLPILSIENQALAAQLGNTLAAGNLAYRYLDAGMVAEAKKSLEGAKADEAHDVKVDEAATEIKKRVEAENEKQKTIEAIAKHQREFFRELGQAIISPKMEGLAGIWKFPFGEIPLEASDGSLTGVVEKTETQSHFAILAGLKSDNRTKSYTVLGPLDGRICDYSLILDEDTSDPTSVPSVEHGYLVFNAKGDSALCLALEPVVKVFRAEKISSTISANILAAGSAEN
jgi:hypothetical protein